MALQKAAGAKVLGTQAAAIVTAARDITQQAANCVKAIKIGGVVFNDPQKIENLLKVMEPWAQGKRMIPDKATIPDIVKKEAAAFRQAVEGVQKWADAKQISRDWPSLSGFA